MADQSPNPTTPRRGKSAGASGAPSPMDTARLSTPSRLSERASAFESPSKAARSLSQGELPEDPSYAQMLKAIVLYSERLLMFDIPATYPPPLGEARIIPFMHLHRDPNVVQHTDGDADVLHHALELTPNITIETDRRTGVSWVGAVDEGQWPTNATVVAVVPLSVAADGAQVHTALQGLCSQSFRTVKRARHSNPKVVDSKNPAEAILLAAREDIPAPQFIMPSDTESREWHIEFECGAAAIVAYKELAEGGAHARTLPGGEVVHFYAKETDNRVQARIDMAHPVLGVGRGVSKAEVAGPVLRLPPRYGSKKPGKRTPAVPKQQKHRPRNAGKRASSNAAAPRRQAPLPSASPINYVITEARATSQGRRAQRSSTAEPRRPPPQEMDGDLSLMRAMRRSPPKGMSRAQMEEAGLVPPTNTTSADASAPPAAAAAAAAAAPAPAPATRATSAKKVPRASLPTRRGLAPLPAPASASTLNESADTMPPPQSPTRTHRPYDTPDAHDDRQCYPPEGEAWEQDDAHHDHRHHHHGHHHHHHHHHEHHQGPQHHEQHHHQHHSHQPPQGPPPGPSYGPSYGPGPGYSYSAGPTAGYDYAYSGGGDEDYDPAPNTYLAEPYPGAFMPSELPAHAAARRAAMYAEYYSSLADSLRPRGPPRYDQTLDLCRAERQKRRAKEKPTMTEKEKVAEKQAAARAVSIVPPESQPQPQSEGEPERLSRRERSARNRAVHEAQIAAAIKAAAAREESASKGDAEEGAPVKKKKTRGCRAGHGRNRGANNSRTTPDTEPAPQSEEPGATGSSAGPSPPAEPAAATSGPSETPAPAAPAAAANGAARSFADLLRAGSPASQKPRGNDAAVVQPTSAPAAADGAPTAKPTRGPSARAKTRPAAPSS